MPKPRPRPQARGLAAGLRAMRNEAKLPMQWVADQLGWSQSTLSRIEAGKRPVTPEEVAALLATYRVDQPEHVRPFSDRIASLTAVALEPEASVRFVAEAAAQYRGR